MTETEPRKKAKRARRKPEDPAEGGGGIVVEDPGGHFVPQDARKDL